MPAQSYWRSLWILEIGSLEAAAARSGLPVAGGDWQGASRRPMQWDLAKDSTLLCTFPHVDPQK